MRDFSHWNSATESSPEDRPLGQRAREGQSLLGIASGLLLDLLPQLLEGHHLDLAGPEPHEDRLRGPPLLAQHDDHVDPFHLGVPDLLADLVIVVIDVDAGIQGCGQLLAVGYELVAHGYQPHLRGRDPERQAGLLVLESLLEQDVDPSLDGAYG